MYILSNINWLHVLVATIAYFVLGAVWYSFLFQKPWIRYHKIDTSDPGAKKGVGAIMFLSFVLFFLITVGLEMIIYRGGIKAGVLSGIKLGLTTGVFFSAAVISINYLYLKKPFALHLIDGLFHVAGQVIAAVILCAWQ